MSLNPALTKSLISVYSFKGVSQKLICQPQEKKRTTQKKWNLRRWEPLSYKIQRYHF